MSASSLLCLPSLSALCPSCVRPCVHSGHAQTVSSTCPLAFCPSCVAIQHVSTTHMSACVCLESASCGRLVSGLVSTLAAPPNLVMSLRCLLSTMCPLKPWPCLWTLPALGQLWGRAVASSSKILSHHWATHSVYIAFPRVSFLHIFIFAHQIRPSQT